MRWFVICFVRASTAMSQTAKWLTDFINGAASNPNYHIHYNRLCFWTMLNLWLDERQPLKIDSILEDIGITKR